MGRGALLVSPNFVCMRISRGILIPANRADFVDDDIIRELIESCLEADTEPFTFTEEENMTMLRLPRRECKHLQLPQTPAFKVFARLALTPPDPRTAHYALHNLVWRALRCSDHSE
jgi:hypothetical protein